MGTELRKLLDNAKGTTEHIIAIVLDVRGFTPFCKEEESLNVANFLKRVYIRIIDDYFPKASFYKPTGDGLLIVIPYSQESLRDTMADTMKSCLNLLQEFRELCKGDDMIYFSTPEKIGIGLSRGTTCCISSGGTIIDYSGRVINLASRLNDFARPSGVVFDSSFGLALLPKEIQELFLCDSVYIRGIAEDKPIAIYFTKQHTIIPPSRKEPLREPEWFADTSTERYGILKEYCLKSNDQYAITLRQKPMDEKQIVLEIRYKIMEDLTSEASALFILDTGKKGVHYVAKGLKHYLVVELPVLMEFIEKDSITDDTEIKFEVSYPSAQKRT